MPKAYLLFLMLIPAWGDLSAQGGENGWPKEITNKKGAVIIYQPQIESFDGNLVEARAAIALKLESDPDKPLFGAIWMSARVDTNRDTRTFSIRELKISDVRFADGKEEQKQKLKQFLQNRLAESDFTLSLDQLLTGLDVDKDSHEKKDFKHTPPEIILSTEPTVLVSFDGAPIIKTIEGTALQQVVNTPFLIIKSGNTFYLSGGGELWYQSKNELGPWKVSNQIPAEVANHAKKNDTKKARQSDNQPIPKIIVATEPSELIVSTGKPSWSPVKDMGLLYMDNTDSDVFLELSTQYYYILLSGRWYRATALGEQWQHIPNDKLPKAFAGIKSDSVNSHVLSQVAGTDQAREAILDNTIPQTSAIRRDAGSASIEYDGRPRFIDVEKVRIQYAVNTESAVFKVNNHYYLAEQGVWYESSSPVGPWAVATSIPDVIYDIPPSNPHYNVTYVRIYDVMPNVVYVGYTPGYMHSYYYHGAVVYGTGWHYRPWHHQVYYPRPWTWGLQVAYNPWIGWSFGLGWVNDPFYLGPQPYPHHRRHYAWYGPGGYRPHYQPHAKRGYRKQHSRPYQEHNRHQRVAMRHNIYSHPNNVRRNVAHSPKRHKLQPHSANNWKNNVYTDRQGNVYRRDRGGQWQQRHKGQWEHAKNLDKSRTSMPHKTPAQPSLHPTKKQERHRSTQSNQKHPQALRPQLERDHNKRQRGTHRSDQYQKLRRGHSQTPRSGQHRPQGGDGKNHTRHSGNRH